jgi:hypothetical protein
VATKRRYGWLEGQSTHPGDGGKHFLCRPGLAIDPVVHGGVEEVSHAYDAGGRRDGLSNQQCRVAGPIPSLMVGLGNGFGQPYEA